MLLLNKTSFTSEPISNDKEVIVFSIKGDEIFKLAYELIRPIQTTLFDF